MLKKINDQENILLIFFVVLLLLVSYFIICNRDCIDIIYFGVVLSYFIRFLVLKYRR